MREGRSELLRRDAVAALDRRPEQEVYIRTKDALRSAPRPASVPPPPSDRETLIDDLSRGGKSLQRRWEAEQKKAEKREKEHDSSEKHSPLIEMKRGAQAKVDQYLTALREEVKTAFAGEDLRPLSRSYGKSIAQKVDRMMEEAQKWGLVVEYGGRVCNRVGYASAWIATLTEDIEHLESLSKAHPGSNPFRKQIDAMKNVRSFFQEVIKGEPEWAQVQEQLDTIAKRPQSEAMRKGKGALRMLGVLAAGGIALLGGLMDIKNGTLSVYTLAWFGLTGWGLGLFKGHAEVVRRQLAFVPDKDWESLCQSLGLTGQSGVEFITSLKLAHKQKSGKKAMEILNSKETQKQRSLDPSTYIPLLVGKNPQGNDAFIAAKLKRLSSEQLYMLCSNITSVTDRTANALLCDFIEHDVNSRSAAADLTKLSPPPSASTPSGTPPADPLLQ